MISMEFDEMKKIWDTQNNQTLYVIDEKAMHNRILSKMNGVLHLTSVSEWVLIMIYLGSGSVLLVLNPFKPGANIFMYVGAAWMFATAIYLMVSRIRRIKANRRFDRSIQGDLDHAISLAGYQVRLSQFIRWSMLPLGAIMIFSGWEGGKLLKVGAFILVSYALAFLVTSKGLRANKRRKHALQVLKEKLEAKT
jgi:hypothetical protein